MKFVKEDFHRINLGKSKYYYSIKTQLMEICIEPCAAGFDVAIFYPNEEIAFPRRCTKHDGYDKTYNSLIGERRDETWKKALEIAGELFDRFPAPI